MNVGSCANDISNFAIPVNLRFFPDLEKYLYLNSSTNFKRIPVIEMSRHLSKHQPLIMIEVVII